MLQLAMGMRCHAEEVGRQRIGWCWTAKYKNSAISTNTVGQCSSWSTWPFMTSTKEDHGEPLVSFRQLMRLERMIRLTVTPLVTPSAYGWLVHKGRTNDA